MTITKQREATRLTKDFPILDCDAHVQDPKGIWDFVKPVDRELVKRSYWNDGRRAVINGRWQVTGAGEHEFDENRAYHSGSIAGPGMNRRLMRRVQSMYPLTQEQMDYVNHKGSYYPEPRLRDMDLMGIDQVLIVPTAMIVHLPYVEDANGARALAGAYNDWLRDFCDTDPKRLFGAGVLPLQTNFHAIDELKRIAERKFPVALVRPSDARGRYPNRILPDATRVAPRVRPMDALFKTFEETQVVLGMHTFTMYGEEPRTSMDSPGELVVRTGLGTGRSVDSQAFAFVFEGLAWLSQILLSGFLDRYPRLKMAVLEANASWLPLLLERCDHLFKLYKNERRFDAKRTPSEAFFDQCIVGFEGDEPAIFRRWQYFEDVAVWASDSYHHDGADAWSALRLMEEAEVPAAVQRKFMGANAARFYGLEQHQFVTEEPAPIVRPDWFPKEDQAFDQWWEREADPRKHGAVARTQGDGQTW